MLMHRFQLAFVLASAAWSQPAAAPRFEVAAVKAMPVPPQARRRTVIGPDRVDLHYVTLWYCISYAYGMKSYQIAGPEWLRNTRYEILAKGPEGARREDLPKMMQALLAERMKLRVHQETRDLPTLALTLGKDGPKLKEAAPESGDGQGGAHVQMSATPTGSERLDIKGGTMSTLVNTLTGLLGLPVVDKTGLAGRYDFV